MVDDILLSPEEQDERAKKWLKDNGMSIVIGVALGLGAVYGFNTYQDQQKVKSEEASALYAEVLGSIKDSDNADIANRVTNLKEDYAGSPYAAKAVLLRARQLSVNNLDDARKELLWVTENTEELGVLHAARIRLAKVLLATKDLAAAEKVASTLPYDGFDSYYHEILADIATQEEDFDLARTEYLAAIDHAGATGAGYVSILNLKMNRLPATSSNEPQSDDNLSETKSGDEN